MNNVPLTMADVQRLLTDFFRVEEGLSEEGAAVRATEEIRRRGGGGWRRMGAVLMHCDNPAAPFSKHTHWSFYDLQPSSQPNDPLLESR